MGEWREYKISEIADVIGGGTPKTAVEEYWGGDIPWLAPRDLTGYNKVYISHGDRFITETGLKNSSTKLMPKGSILLTSRAPIGYVAIAENDICTNQGFKSLVPKSNISNSEFLYYWIKANVDYLQQLGTGTTFAEISGNVVKNIDISLPPIKEQKAIAEVLSSFDDKIDLLHRQNKTLEELAGALFRQWFIEEAKEEWEEVSIGEFVKTNVSSISKKDSLTRIKYLDTGSLNEGKIDSLQNVDISEAPSRAKRKVKHNNILISTVRPNQKHYGIVKNPDENLIVSTGFCVIECENIDPHFIYLLLTTNDMTEYLHSIAEASTSTYPSLKPIDIELLEFKLPPQDKLDEFANYANNAWEKIDKNHKQTKTLENMRDTLLPKLMSREVRVKYERKEKINEN